MTFAEIGVGASKNIWYGVIKELGRKKKELD
jgi:hypothetical protein